MKTVLVVGGAGYIGAHTNKELCKNGYKTVVYDNLNTGHKGFCLWGNFFQGDLNDIRKLQEVFTEYPIDTVMHFAGSAYVGESVVDPEKYYLNNVRNTLNLLQVMREFKVNKIIFSSSCSIYGIPEELPIKEDSKQNPINPYGWSKLMIEQILKDYSKSYGLRFMALRYFNAAGADPESEIGEWHEPETHVIPLILDAASGRIENLKVFGNDYPTSDGTCIRDYIHVSDIAHAHVLALDFLNRGGESQCFNLGNSRGYSIKELIATAESVTKKKVPFLIESRREGDPHSLIGNTQRAVEILAWRAQYSDLNTIIESAWRWYLKVNGLK